MNLACGHRNQAHPPRKKESAWKNTTLSLTLPIPFCSHQGDFFYEGKSECTSETIRPAVFSFFGYSMVRDRKRSQVPRRRRSAASDHRRSPIPPPFFSQGGQLAFFGFSGRGARQFIEEDDMFGHHEPGHPVGAVLFQFIGADLEARFFDHE